MEHTSRVSFYVSTPPIHGTIQVSTWEELQERVNLIDAWLQDQELYRPLVFRGQADSWWRLETTLERRGRTAQIKCIDYFNLAESIRQEVGAVGLMCEMPDLEDTASKLHSATHFGLVPASLLPGAYDNLLDFWIHLRHHNFPSPLLDWSLSLDVAAFFAFHDTQASIVSIYAFAENPLGLKSIWAGDPWISHLSYQNPNLLRHSKQSAEYTVCSVPYGPEARCSFTQHQEGLTLQSRRQDCLTKFDIPSAEGVRILKELELRGKSKQTLLPPVELDNHMEQLIDRVFGTKGTEYSRRIR